MNQINCRLPIASCRLKIENLADPARRGRSKSQACPERSRGIENPRRNVDAASRQRHLRYCVLGLLGLVTCVFGDELRVDYGSIGISFEEPKWSERQVIVKFKPGVSKEDGAAVLHMYGCSVVGDCPFAPWPSHELCLVDVPEPMTADEMAGVFANEPLVEYAELNYYATISFVPDDTFFRYQWNLSDPASGGIGVEAAWDIQTGDPNVIVAVLDTGVAYEDFERFKQAPDLAGTRFVPGYDFVNDDSHPNDDHGHGTHVAGTIAENTNNGLGVAGVAFGCSIMPVKVISAKGQGSHFDIANGIYFAVSHGAKVINMSLGGDQDSITLKDAVAYAYSKDVTVVAAAGNEFLEGSPPSYPAAYDDYCIAVGATRYDETRAYYSNVGSYLDVVAPGGDLLVDQNGDGYGDGILQQTFSLDPTVFAYWFFQGTSMATPHVSGAAALLISNGVTKPARVRQALESTAKDLGPPGWDEQYGWGLINIGEALRYRAAGDLSGDLSVSLADFSLMADRWLQGAARSHPVDLNGDGIVNFVDFAILAQEWSP
jgi:serine protease